jgi:hypothetical protein
MVISAADNDALEQLTAYLRGRGYLVVKRDRATIDGSGTTARCSSATCASGGLTTAA